MSPATCPSPDELAAFSSGRLSAERFEALAEHLECCATCQSALETASSGSEPWLAALRQPPAIEPFQEEPQCRAAVARFEAALVEATRPDEDARLGQVGYYQLLGKLGRGGMGQVYRARHVLLQQEVALKVLPPERVQDPQAVARFYREMEAVGRLRHPNIVAARDAGQAGGTHYLVMELVEGIDLAKLVGLAGPLSIPDACEVVRQAARGLQHAHEHHLIHRDVKPSNLLLTPDGQVKVLDLGLARFLYDEPAAGEELTPAGLIVGTVEYLAPETVTGSGAVDARADLYSLGCTLYKLLTGRVPFRGPAYDTRLKQALAHARDPVPAVQLYRPEVPEPLAALVHRLLAKSPAERFVSAAEVAAALQPFTTGCDLPALFQRAAAKRDATPAAESGDTPDLGPASSGPSPNVGSTQEYVAQPAASVAASPGGTPPGKQPPLAPGSWRTRPRHWAALRRRLALAASFVGVLVVAIVLFSTQWRLQRSATQNQALQSEIAPPQELSQQIQPPLLGLAAGKRLAVVSLTVEHYRGDPPQALGALGNLSTSALADDDVRVRARLSRPASCYLIAFLPNGKEQLCFPRDPNAEPLPVDFLVYPAGENRYFGLTDGVGLEAFVLFASEQPLPPYAAWRRSHPLPAWRTIPAREGVWQGDAQGLRLVSRASRSEREKQGAPQELAVLYHFFQEQPGRAALQLLAFPVLPKP